MEDFNMGVLDEEMPTLPESPESSDEENCPPFETLIEKEALKLANYIGRKAQAGREMAAQNGVVEDDSEEGDVSEISEIEVPTDDLLQIGRTPQTKFAKPKVTKQLCEMFGFDATCTPSVRRKRQSNGSDTLFSLAHPVQTPLHTGLAALSQAVVNRELPIPSEKAKSADKPTGMVAISNTPSQPSTLKTLNSVERKFSRDKVMTKANTTVNIDPRAKAKTTVSTGPRAKTNTTVNTGARAKVISSGETKGSKGNNDMATKVKMNNNTVTRAYNTKASTRTVASRKSAPKAAANNNATVSKVSEPRAAGRSLGTEAKVTEGKGKVPSRRMSTTSSLRSQTNVGDPTQGNPGIKARQSLNSRSMGVVARATRSVVAAGKVKTTSH